MKKVLFMHGGSGNHGCEAIVRTTSRILNGPENVLLWSYARAQDEKYGVDRLLDSINATEELVRFSPAYFEMQIRRRLLGHQDANRKVFLKHLFKDRLAVAIGGDNYCYPWSAKDAVEMNREIRKYAVATVLWGCSVDPEAITPEVADDLAKYDLITAREQITYELLKKLNPNTIKVADPAFLLEKEMAPLPAGFMEGNTVGINVSPLILGYTDNRNIVLENYEKLIRYILENTNMQICMIPHVVWEGNDDRVPIAYLMERFADTQRICTVPDGNACVLKGYISRCRFFVGARTHATIAAYSSCVPTLVAGYSVKSRGIALDLFGAEEHYVVPVQNMETDNALLDQFVWLMKYESEIRRRLEQIMPEYLDAARSAEDAVKKLTVSDMKII